MGDVDDTIILCDYKKKPMSNTREQYTRVEYPSDIASSKNPLVTLASFSSCMCFLKFNFTSFIYDDYP